MRAKSKLNNVHLWNLIANSAQNSIEAGGWFDSYTHNPFSTEEMKEYVRDTEKLLLPYINKNAAVLEIGCSSGLTMEQLCPQVSNYCGIDISTKEIDWCQKLMIEKNFTNYALMVLSADQIDTINDKFNIIILNSVVHCFDDEEYLIDVLEKACALLYDFGIIYLGDIMDYELKNELLSSLIHFKEKNPNSKTKISLESELFISKSFFSLLPNKIPAIRKVNIYDKSGAIDNELKKYRYNVILEICTKQLSIKGKEEFV